MLPFEEVPDDEGMLWPPEGVLDPCAPDEDDDDMPELLPEEAGAFWPAVPTFPDGVCAIAIALEAMVTAATTKIPIFLKLMNVLLGRDGYSAGYRPRLGVSVGCSPRGRKPDRPQEVH
jgi:hypothetical protein